MAKLVASLVEPYNNHDFMCKSSVSAYLYKWINHHMPPTLTAGFLIVQEVRLLKVQASASRGRRPKVHPPSHLDSSGKAVK